MTDSVLNVILRISSLCRDRHVHLRDVCAYVYENVPKLEHDNDAVLNLLFCPFEIASNIVNEQEIFLALSLQGILFLLRLRRITDKTLYLPPNIPIPAKKKGIFTTSDVTIPTQENSLNNGSSSDTKKLVDVILETLRRHSRSLLDGVAPLVLQCLSEFIYSCDYVGNVKLVDCFQSAFEAQLRIKSLPEFEDSNTILKKIITIILKKRTNYYATHTTTTTTTTTSAPPVVSTAPPSSVSFSAQDATKLGTDVTTDCLEESYNATLVSVPEEALQLSVGDDHDNEGLLGAVNAQPEWLIRYDQDCYEILLRICYLSTKNFDNRASLKSLGLRCRRLSCTLLAHFLHEMDVEFASSNLFESALHKNIILSLLYNCTSEDSDLYCTALEILYYLVVYHAAHLKSKVIVFVLGVLLPMVESKKTSYHQKNTILTFFDFALRSPQVLSDWFTNFDCVQGMTNLCEIFVSRLSKLAKMSHVSGVVTVKQDEALRFACIKVLCTFVRSVESISNVFQAAGYSINSDKNLNEREKYESGKISRNNDEQEEGDMTTRASSVLSREAGSLTELKLHEDMKTPEEMGGQSRTSVNSGISSYTDIEQLLRGKKTFDAVVKAFNAREHKAALAMAQKYNLLSSQTPEVVAQFLLKKELDPISVGEFLCKANDERKGILSAFIGLNDFSNLSIDEAMRVFLGKFKLPGEAQVIDRVMEIFAKQYCAQNPDSFSGPSPAFILAFSIMLLNTDAHSSQITEKMTLEQFIRNNKGIDDGKDLPQHLLEGIYQRITTREILLEGRGIMQSPSLLRRHSKHKKRTFMLSSSSSSSSQSTSTKTSTTTTTTTIVNSTNTTSTIRVPPPTTTTARTGATGVAPTTTRETTLNHGKARMISHQAESDYLAESSLERITLDVSTEPYNSLTSPEVAGALLESTWTALLVAFSVPMEETANMDLIDTCLEGIEYAIKVSCKFSCRTERKAFISALLAFTHLTNLREIEYKSLKSIVVLIRIALEEGDYLETSWYEILHCVSLLSKLQILSSSSPARGGTTLMGNDTNNGDDSNIHSSTGSKKEQRTKLERQNAETIARYIDEVEVHRLFSRSSRLKDESVVNFVEALCLVSAEELGENPPRLFSLQKLVEVTDANIGRLRYAWSKMWANISRHFVTVGLGSNQLVSMFVVDHLRQLARKFLLRKELGDFNFQKDVLRPFEDIAFRTKSSALKELIIASLGQMVDLQPESLVSGWNPLLTALGHCVRNEDNEEVICRAAMILQRITLNHLCLLSSQDLLCLLNAWEAIGRSISSEDTCQVAIWYIRFIAILLIACDVLNNMKVDEVKTILENLPHPTMSPKGGCTNDGDNNNSNSNSNIENSLLGGGGSIFKEGNNSLLPIDMIKYMTSFFISSLRKNEVENNNIKQNTISFCSVALSILASLVMHKRVGSDAIDAMMSLMSSLREILTMDTDTWWYIFSSTVLPTITYLLEQCQLRSTSVPMRLYLLKQTVMGIVRFSRYDFSLPSATVDHALFLLQIVFGGICIGGNDAAIDIGFHGGRQILHNFEKYTGTRNENLWNNIVQYIHDVGSSLMGELESTWCYSIYPNRLEKAVSIILALLHYVKPLRDVALIEGLTMESRTKAVNILLDILRRLMLILRTSFSTTVSTSDEVSSYTLALFIALERSVCNIVMKLDEEYNTFMKEHINTFWSLIVQQLAFIATERNNKAHQEEAESLRVLVVLLLDSMHQLPVSLMIPRVKANMPLFCQLIAINDRRFAASLGSLFLKYHTGGSTGTS
ncbi:Sec7 domain [Trypanosoma melophagium]|uniref:Sec7 domain n=1 Tax=Trypanosoma melophagium TaxID=715481 RepID=UPI00351A4AF8|nr:Sec7 domain [Trypanosoma melophagium]